MKIASKILNITFYVLITLGIIALSIFIIINSALNVNSDTAGAVALTIVITIFLSIIVMIPISIVFFSVMISFAANRKSVLLGIFDIIFLGIVPGIFYLLYKPYDPSDPVKDDLDHLPETESLLNRYKELYDKGFISEQEYKDKKALIEYNQRGMNNLDGYRCPKCNKVFKGKVDYCPHCGEKMKW